MDFQKPGRRIEEKGDKAQNRKIRRAHRFKYRREGRLIRHMSN